MGKQVSNPSATGRFHIMIISVTAMMVYHHRYELIAKFLENGYDVTVVAPEAAETKNLIDLGCKFININVNQRGKNPIMDIIFCRRLVKIIKNEKPDAALPFYTKTNIYGSIAARVTRTPYIANITGLGSAIENGGLMRSIMMNLYRVAVRNAECLFFQNTYNRDFFKRFNIRSKSCRLLPGSGVALDRFKEMPYPDENKPMVFIFISRIIREKGIDQYIEAARYFKRKYNEMTFHVVGPCEDDSYADLLKRMDGNGIIKYHGKQLDVRPFIMMSNAVVFPSHYSDGMANVLLEGAASGRPLITTSRPGCGEAVEDGVSGLLVRGKDLNSLIDAIQRFIDLPYEKKAEMGHQGRKKMERQFDRSIVVDAYCEEIEKIFERTR